MESVTDYSRYYPFYPCIYLEELTETKKTSIRIAGALADIQTEHILETSIEWYKCLCGTCSPSAFRVEK
jgi:hypothetical protein